MSLFNFKRKGNKRIKNRAGGDAFAQSPRLQLCSILLTSFAQDQFYRSANDTFDELVKLIPKVDTRFAAKAAIYARKEFGMRSISHVLAAELAAYASGRSWAKEFYRQVIKRPDDMLEIMAYFYAKGGNSLPNAMKKGFAKAFDQFDSYQIGKYRGNRKAVKLIDLVNLVHPRPTARNAEALQALVANRSTASNTWEAKLTQAGQTAKSDKDKTERKAKVWEDLMSTNKLGYFALLRNLRNIAEQAPQLTELACQQLTDRKRIKNSLVLPFRFLTAVDAINASADIASKRRILDALHRALETSLDNVPRFAGKTLVVLDDSASMTWGQKNMGRTPIQIGSIFAAMLYKSNDADLIRFSDDASYVWPYHRNSAISIADQLIKDAKSAGTNFHAIFRKADKAYDRIVLLSDMQGWMGQYAPTKEYQAYKERFDANPYIYSFDLSAYGSLQLPEDKVFCLAGFSDKVFDIMNLLETDRQALINKIEAVQL
ncbi:MAG: TROVE domain-containing protein [Bacteroidota bacterium]